jgi:hypothetical protein
MELEDIKVVKKTQSTKKLVKKQEDDLELEAPIEDEPVVKKKVVKKVVKKAKTEPDEEIEEINKDLYCWDQKKIIASLKKVKNNTFYEDNIKDKPFNPEWVGFVLSTMATFVSTKDDNKLFNQLFENAKPGQYINNNELLGKMISENTDYYENHGENWIENYMVKYKWIRTNIENGFIVTPELILKVRKYFAIYDELTLVYFEKKTSREPWQNQKIIEKLYKAEAIVLQMFIDKNLTTEKNKQKFITLSEAYFKKDNTCFNERNNLGVYFQFMLSQSNYYNEYVIISLLCYYDIISNYLILNKKYFPVDISMDIINNFMKKNNKVINLNKMYEITKEYNCCFEDYEISHLINNIYKYKFTEFKKINMSELLNIYKTTNTEDKIEKLEYFVDHKFTDEDYYSLMLIYNFSDELLKKYGEKILKNNELSKKIFYDAANTGNDIIIEYFLLNKYNVTDEDIINTHSSNILLLYKENNIFMTKDLLYKYYRRNYNNCSIDALIKLSEYHNHPEDFEEIRKEIELTEFEELICNSDRIHLLIDALEKKPIVTLDMIVYLANNESKNILYDYYLKQK